LGKKQRETVFVHFVAFVRFVQKRRVHGTAG